MTRAAPLMATQPMQVTSLHGLVTALEDVGRASRVSLAAVANGESRQPDAFVADTVHLFALLHGELPSLFDSVARGNADFAAWLKPAVATFHADRAWLTDLCVLTGPSTDLLGITEAETLVRGLRDAMLTLAESSRDGCALGAVLAFLADWPELRAAIDSAGTLVLSARWPSPSMNWPAAPLHAASLAAEAAFASRPRMRALAFGAQQFIHIHAQLLDLVASRAAARRSR